MEQKEKISKKLLVFWPTRTIAITIFSIMMGYATYFATNHMGLSTATVGILFMLSKLFDGFTDIIAGYFIEKTHTKLGKGRPYELALIGYGVCVVLLFGAPKMGIAASYIYLFVMYTLINSVFLTLLNCGEPVYMANAINCSQDSVSLSTVGGIIAMIVAIISGVIIPQLVKMFANEPNGWLMISCIISIPCTLVGLIRFFTVKEKHQSEISHEQVTFKDLLQAIVSNKYIIIFSLIILVSNIGNGLANAVATYYAQYIIGDIGAQSVLSLGALAAIVGIVVVQMFSSKIGLTKIMKILTALGFAGYMIRLVNPSNLMICFISSCLSTLAFTVMFSFVAAFIIDCMDYGEWKTGVRREGAISSAQSVTAKVGTAIGAGMVGILMGISHYDNTAAVQPASANMMLIAMTTVIPAAFCVLQYVLLHFYDIDKYLDQIHADLAEKRK